MVASIAVVGLVVAVGCERAAEPARPVVETVDPATTLRQMSDTLAQARQLTFTATRELDPALALGGSVKESAEIEVWVSRPQKMRARVVSGADVRSLYFDGHQFSLIDEGMKVYATTPLTGSIDELIDALDARYGFTPPLAEFVLSDPYKKFSAQTQDTKYKGRETISGVDCHRLTLIGEIADADVWISIADYLPRRFVATFKDREGSPQLRVDFSAWNLAVTLEEPVFVFDPPRDAEKIVMATLEDAHAADAKGGTK